MKLNHSSINPVVIIGGGFAGLTTALKLRKLSPLVPIVIVDPKTRFIFLPLLYELLSDELKIWDVAPKYSSVLNHKSIIHCRDKSIEINTDLKTICFQNGKEINYSSLVIATGSKPCDFGIAGALENSHQFSSISDLEPLIEMLRFINHNPIEKKFRLLIVGAGPTGIELACKLSDLVLRTIDIKIIDAADKILMNSKSFNREQGLKELKRRNIEVLLNHQVQNVDKERITCINLKEKINSEVSIVFDDLIWAAGTRPNIPKISPSITFLKNKILVNQYMEVIGLTNVYASGDISLVDEKKLPSTAQVAIQQGDVIARNIYANMHSNTKNKFEFVDLGEMLSLGIGNATITGLGVTLAGKIAYELRHLIYISRMPNFSLSVKSASAWLLRKTSYFRKLKDYL